MKIAPAKSHSRKFCLLLATVFFYMELPVSVHDFSVLGTRL